MGRSDRIEGINGLGERGSCVSNCERTVGHELKAKAPFLRIDRTDSLLACVLSSTCVADSAIDPCMHSRRPEPLMNQSSRSSAVMLE